MLSLFRRDPFFDGIESMSCLLEPLLAYPASKRSFASPVCNVRENDEAIVVEANLPGAQKGDMSVNLSEGLLTLSAEIKTVKDKEEEDPSGVVWHSKERYHGTYKRCFSVPKETTPEDVNADFSEGVLRVTVKKNKASTEGAIKIPIQ
jgi:HSP20 family protein